VKVYVAAPYAVRDLLDPYLWSLVDNGHTLVSSWTQASHSITKGTLDTAPALTDEYAKQHSEQDVTEVKVSEALLLVPWPKAVELAGKGVYMGENSGGHNVEMGVALALDKPVVVWGRPANIFQRGLGNIAEDWDAVLKTLKEIEHAQ
jgi:hypothetical protein